MSDVYAAGDCCHCTGVSPFQSIVMDCDSSTEVNGNGDDCDGVKESLQDYTSHWFQMKLWTQVSKNLLVFINLTCL